jgi:hypothetical protein
MTHSDGDLKAAIRDLTARLAEVPGIPGHEQLIAQVVYSRLRSLVDEPACPPPSRCATGVRPPA